MKWYRIFAVLLAVVLCLGLTACGGGEEIPEVSKEDLSAMTDAELIPLLLDRYASYTEPRAFAGEMSQIYRSGDSVIASMQGSFRSNGVDRTMTVTSSAGDKSKTAVYTFSGGVFYASDGEAYQCPATEEQVVSYFSGKYPSFGAVSEYGFVRKDLLRSDNGEYTLVLSGPVNALGNADVTGLLTAWESPVTLSSFSEIYLTLWFSPEGDLRGQTLGFDCKMTTDGIETEGTVRFQFLIRSVDPVQPPISAPEGAESYKTAEKSPFEA